MTRSSAPSATASSGSSRPRPPTTSTRSPTSSPCTCPRRPRPRAGSTPRRWPSARTACAILNVARGPLVVDEDLQAALDSGKVAGAALDVFRSEPVTDHPLFAYPNVIVTPHLGASTAEATDRAGYQAAEQVVAALTGGVVTSAVNVPAISAEDMEVLGPYVPLCRLAGPDRDRPGAAGPSVDGLRTEFLGRLAERDTRLLSLEVLRGVLDGHVEEEVNAVNAPAIAEERGTEVTETKHTVARDYTDLVRVEVRRGRHVAARRRHPDRPPQPPAPARGLGPALRRPARGPHHRVPLPGPARHARAGGHGVRRRTGSTSSRPRSAASPSPTRPATASWRRW